MTSGSPIVIQKQFQKESIDRCRDRLAQLSAPFTKGWYGLILDCFSVENNNIGGLGLDSQWGLAGNFLCVCFLFLPV